MLKKALAFSSVAVFLAGAAWATPSCCSGEAKHSEAGHAKCEHCKQAEATQINARQGTKGTKTKLTEVKVCPLMLAPVSGKGSESQVVGKYKVYFCCQGCKPAFNKLSKAEQTKKIAVALKKQQQNARKKTS